MNDRVEIYKGADKKWYWRTKGGNNEITANGEGYESKQGVQKAVRHLFADLPVKEVEE